MARRWLLFVALAASACGADADPERSELQFRGIAGSDVFAVIVPPGTSAARLLASAKAECGQREFCHVHAWASEMEAATGMPMTDSEVAARVFSYSVNRSTGFDRFTFDCSFFADAPKENCMTAEGPAAAAE